MGSLGSLYALTLVAHDAMINKIMADIHLDTMSTINLGSLQTGQILQYLKSKLYFLYTYTSVSPTQSGIHKTLYKLIFPGRQRNPSHIKQCQDKHEGTSLTDKTII